MYVAAFSPGVFSVSPDSADNQVRVKRVTALRYVSGVFSVSPDSADNQV